MQPNGFMHPTVMAYDKEISRTKQINRIKLIFQPTNVTRRQ